MPGVPCPLARNPEQDKFSRVAGVSAMIEAGQLLLPPEAHWLAWARTDMAMDTPTFGAPIYYFEDGDGNIRSSEDDDYEQFMPPDTSDPWGAGAPRLLPGTSGSRHLIPRQLRLSPNSRVCSRFFQRNSSATTSAGSKSGEVRCRMLKRSDSGLPDRSATLPPCPVRA